jgi:hypothetical protein
MAITLVVRSTESKHLFPSNKPYDFTIALPKRLVFKEQWTIELSEFYTASTAKTTKKELFIHCDACDMSVVGEQYRPLLRRVVLGSNKNQIFTRPYPVPLRNQELEKIRLEIRDKDNQPATFLNDDISLTLIFQLATVINPLKVEDEH